MTIKIPMHTRINAITDLLPKAWPSLRINVDKITPNTGLANPYTDTLETGLYFNKIPQIE